LSPPGDPAALALAITEVLTPQCRSGAVLYRARTWNACAADITELFENLRTAGPRSFAIAGNEELSVASPCGEEELAVAGPVQ
jgi:hypothetical protein